MLPVVRNMKSVNLEEKLDVIERYECNEHIAGIASAKFKGHKEASSEN
jgi:hypothetical protein